jgi:transposase-like protein
MSKYSGDDYKELAREYKETLIAVKGLIRFTMAEDIKCKYCDSLNVVKFGHYKGVQRYFCKACKHKFTLADTLPKGKVPIRLIADAIGMYYCGMSLNNISEHIEQEYGTPATNAAIYNWLIRYSKQAVEKTKGYIPKVGDVWVADEVVLFIGGKKFWLIDIIDHDTRFLLATRLSLNRGRKDIALLLRKAYLKAGKAPKRILTDGWKVYPDAVDLVFGAETKHTISTPFVEKDSTNIIERFQGSLKDRTKVMRGMKKPETAMLILDGWLVYYNFFRPHDSLEGKTPAQVAGIKFPYANWETIVRSNKPIIEVAEKDKYPPDKHYRIHLAKSTVHRMTRSNKSKRAISKSTQPTLSTLRIGGD